MPGTAEGTFAPRVDYISASKPLSIAIGDLNADGRLDLAVANDAVSGASVSVFPGTGDGSFAARTDLSLDRSPRSVAIGDLNGDGRPDLAVLNDYTNAVSVLLGRGDGTFAAKVDYPTGPRPSQVAIGDLDRDVRADLAVANYYSSSVSVLFGRGDGTFQPRVNYGSVSYA